MSTSHKLLVSPSPHIHSGDSIERNMYDVIIALIPALAVSFYFFGWGAFVVTLTSVAACMLFEWLISRFLMGRKELTILDGSAILTGLLLALNVPSTLPLWIIVIGALVAIGIGKMSFGGLGSNIFNPAIVGRVMLLISFPVQMTSYPMPRGMEATLDATSGATPLAIAKGIVRGSEGFSMDKLPSLVDNLLGSVGGSLGEVSAVALLIGFAYLLIRKVITWHIPVAIIVTVAIFAGIMNLANPEVYAGPLFHILSGGLLLGAIFMATDYVTSPMSNSGMLLYGVMIGIITMLIRLFGAYPEGMSFAILFMNGIVPIINRYMPPHLFGKAKK
ncbi:MAG: RnfABCDGE type electron transport complex subunit D [Porphyromonas somerae]|uniref:RnfABCDGE type electron transport complex subunit D n=1 Tax=Porphyromonas somerae TaxID=322095 RepID=UPI0026F2BD1E|nr:RnfABCDGE type electron transport complex subunit D [Porphyromonas somerae]MDD7557073.1 RnfABCDGE type electron transport complex subunit D [Porphyromonas somerae]MDY3884920.1 RnfABCDGE type electron transport complex subunit D [Porphyromonas somerae]MDY5815733.1 RnfABCDGE type electron transport complex subunit D [Porphyromonas somerae]